MQGGNPNVAAIVLAAGASSRLGRAKQLLVYRGKTLVRRAVEAAGGAGCSPVIVVAGAEPGVAGAVEGRVDAAGVAVVVVHAAEWAAGMGASIRAGIGAVPGDVDGVLLCLCDQPLVDAGVLRRLVDRHARGSGGGGGRGASGRGASGRGASGREAGERGAERERITAAVYGGAVGVPALFDRAFLPELKALPVEAGAKRLLAIHEKSVVTVDMPEAACDIDTAAEYEGLET